MQKKTKVYVGMDVHKDTVMIAVLAEGAREPTVVKRLSRSSQLQTNPNSCRSGSRLTGCLREAARVWMRCSVSRTPNDNGQWGGERHVQQLP